MKAGKGSSQTQPGQFDQSGSWHDGNTTSGLPGWQQQTSGGMGGNWDSPQMQQWLQSMPSDLMPWFMQMFGGMGGGWPNNQMSGWQQGMGGGMMPPGAGMMPQMNPLQARRRANAAAAGGGGGGWSRTTGPGSRSWGTRTYDETNDPLATGTFTPKQLNALDAEYAAAGNWAERSAVLDKWGLGGTGTQEQVSAARDAENAAYRAYRLDPSEANRATYSKASSDAKMLQSGPHYTYQDWSNTTDQAPKPSEWMGVKTADPTSITYADDKKVRPEKTREEYDAEQLELQEAAQAKYNAPEDPNDALIRMAAYRDMLGGGYYGGVIPPSLTNPQFASTNPWTELAKLGFRTPEGMQYKWGQNPNIAYGKSPWGQSATSRGGPWMQGPDRGDIQSGGYRQGVLWPGIWG